MATVVRNSLSYHNMDVLEKGYGISLRPLALFAERTYKKRKSVTEMAKIAISIILFKLEGQIIMRHPEYNQDDRLMLHRINYEKGTIDYFGTEYPLKDTNFPTVDPKDPYKLSEGEEMLMETLTYSFLHSKRLQKHMRYIYSHGSMYKVCNNNLLFHGCIPMTEGGRFQAVDFAGVEYSGKSMMDHYDALARAAYHRHVPSAVDFMWYLWCHHLSPVCGRHIKTFERAYVLDKTAWEEPQDPYYRHCETEEGCLPLKAGGKLVVIDGGFSRSFHKRTGIAGYTLIGNSHGLRLASHQPFTSIQDVLKKNADIHSDSKVFFTYRQRFMIGRTDTGRAIQKQISLLQDLLDAYRSGWRPEGYKTMHNA